MAKWILNPEYPTWYEWYICSNCKSSTHKIEVNGKLIGGHGPEAIGARWIGDKVPFLSPYCPFCGEKMENPTIEGD